MIMHLASSQAPTELTVVGHAAGGDEHQCQAGRPPVEQDRLRKVGECGWRDSIVEVDQRPAAVGEAFSYALCP